MWNVSFNITINHLLSSDIYSNKLTLVMSKLKLWFVRSQYRLIELRRVTLTANPTHCLATHLKFPTMHNHVYTRFKRVWVKFYDSMFSFSFCVGGTTGICLSLSRFFLFYARLIEILAISADSWDTKIVTVTEANHQLSSQSQVWNEDVV